MRQKSASGTIVARKNGFMPRYYVIDASGARKDRYGHLHETKKAARAELTALLHSLNVGTHVDRSAGTVAEWLGEWLDNWTGKAGPKAKERYREQLTWYVIPRIGDVALQALDTEAVQGLIRQLAQQGRRRQQKGQSAGLHPNTVRSVLRVLKRAMAKAVLLKKRMGNPCDGVELPAAPDDAAVRQDERGTVDVHDCLSQEQLTQMLDAFKGNDMHTMVVLFAATGCRRGELLALHWKDVDLDAKTLHVRQTLEATGEGKTRRLRLKSPKTKGSDRTIDLPAAAVAELREYRTTQRQLADKVSALLPRDALVFPAKPWEPQQLQDPGLVSARFSALAKRRGFRVHLHQLRHTHASLLLRAGIPVPDVAARLGHGNPGVTMKTYAHAIKSEQAHTVAAVNRMLGG